MSPWRLDQWKQHLSFVVAFNTALFPVQTQPVWLHVTSSHTPTRFISAGPLLWWKLCGQWHHHSETTEYHYREQWKCSPGQRVTSQHRGTVQLSLLHCNHGSNGSRAQQLWKPTQGRARTHKAQKSKNISLGRQNELIYFLKSSLLSRKSCFMIKTWRLITCSRQPRMTFVYLFAIISLPSFVYPISQEPTNPLRGVSYPLICLSVLWKIRGSGEFLSLFALDSLLWIGSIWLHCIT